MSEIQGEITSKVGATNLHHVEQMLLRAKNLNQISPSMCLAKWLQSTVYLQNGYTHSCHHPAPHKIPLEEIQKSADALHNTSFKREQRRQMLEGIRPKECDYCWRVEDLGKDQISDRIYKSTDLETSWPLRRDVMLAGADGPIEPSYLEVSFSHQCNLKCAYCSPEISSKWMEEALEYGPYPTSKSFNGLDYLRQTNRMPIPKDDPNPYVAAFWDWWPKLYPKLRVFRITGGEPLLSDNTWRMLEYIVQNPRPDLKLAINSNFCILEKHIDRLIEIERQLQGKVKSFEIFTSCEAVGAQAEYTRFGMRYPQFIANVKRYLSQAGPNSRVNFMTTFNVLSVTTFKEFLDQVFQLRIEFNTSDGFNRVPLTVSYLRWPDFLSVSLLPESIRIQYANEYFDFVQNRVLKVGPHPVARFYLEEYEQVRRLCDFLRQKAPATKELAKLRGDFYRYVTEYDRRRGTDFRATFPELKDFLVLCQAL